MKRLPHIKQLKRLNILHRPTAVQDIANEIDVEAYTDTWLLEAEKIQTKRLRRFRQQLAS
jgi:orotate phosphoribosyltransferase-like protein